MNTTNKHEQMWESLRDPEVRKQLIEEHISVGIAFQIRALRDRQKLTQTKLAGLLGGKQPLISEWENPNYGNYTLGTLKELAKAFDVGLLVRFVPFGKLVDWTINLTSDVIAPPSFGEEEMYRVVASAPTVPNSVENTKDADAYELSLLAGILAGSSTLVTNASAAETAKELIRA